MNDAELLRIIEFVDSTRSPFVAQLPDMAPDSDWALTSYLVKARLLQQDVTISQLIKASGLPYGTAHRRVNSLIEQGLIDLVPTSPSGRTHWLVPGHALLRGFEALALHVKSLVATLVGHRDGSQTSDQYYFGEPRAAIEQLLPPTDLFTLPNSEGHRLRFLFHDDNYFVALRNLWIDFRVNAGRSEDFRLERLPELYELALANGTRDESEFDIIVLNYPWLAEFAAKELIAPLDIDAHANPTNLGGFHPVAWECLKHDEQLYAWPMFANVESLLARRDIFEANAIQYPASLKDLLTVARRLHKPKRGQYGLAWNAARGMPIASAFMFFLNAHGGTVIDAEEKTAPGRSRSDRKPRVRATLDTPQAHATLAFMQRLLSVSPPDTLAFTWEDSLNEFMSGRAALCYAWSMRAARLELDLRSKVKGKVEFLPHPNIHGVRRSVPLGGFCLAVPSNLPPERAAVAQEAIRWLTSSDAVQSRGRNALPIATRFGVGSDPEMTAISHIVNFVDNLVRHGLVCNTMRPITPVYSRIEDLLGVEIHNALCGLISPEAALQKIQAKAQDLLDSIARPDEVPRRADNRAS